MQIDMVYYRVCFNINEVVLKFAKYDFFIEGMDTVQVVFY